MLPVPDPAIAAGVVGCAALYLRGARHPGPDRGGDRWWFLGGLAVLVLATARPVEAAAAGSFAWHMVQHQLLMLVAAPMLAAGRPVAVLRRAVARRGPPAGAGGHPPAAEGDTTGDGALSAGVLAALAAAAGVAYLAVLLLWHLPSAYDAAVADDRLHGLEHLTLLGAAVALWLAVLAAGRRERGVGAAVGALAATAIAGAGLGVVLLMAPTVLYETYAGQAALDQQRLGGALMKVGTLLVHTGAAVWLALGWLHRLDAPDQERRRVPARR